MATRRSAQLAIGFSKTFKRQTTWDTPLGASEMNAAFPATSRNWLAMDETVEDIYDCTNEDLLIELVTGRLARLTIDFDVDPDLLAGWSAFNYGVAASPSGGTNEVQTLTIAGAGGYNLAWTHNFNRQVTATPLTDASNAAAITAALEALSNIGAGNVVVAGAGPFTITFQGALVDYDVSLVELLPVTGSGITGTVVETTPGVGRTHNISRLATYQLPFTTLYVGFRNSDKQPVIFKNVVCNIIRVRSTARERVTATVELIGSADLQDAVGYTMPACMDIDPVRFGDCELTVNGESLYDPASIWGVDNNGVAVARDWEYYHQNDVLTGTHPFTGRGVDITRLERADRRPSGINIGSLGEKGDRYYNIAKGQVPRSIGSAVLRVGGPNRYCEYRVPQGIIKLDNPGIRFEGEANESNIRSIVRPKKVSGDATTPSNIQAKTEQTVAYLISA